MGKKIDYDAVLNYVTDYMLQEKYLNSFSNKHMYFFKSTTKAMSRFIDSDSEGVKKKVLADLNNHKYMYNRINDVILGCHKGLYFFILTSNVDLETEIRKARETEIRKIKIKKLLKTN